MADQLPVFKYPSFPTMPPSLSDVRNYYSHLNEYFLTKNPGWRAVTEDAETVTTTAITEVFQKHPVIEVGSDAMGIRFAAQPINDIQINFQIFASLNSARGSTYNDFCGFSANIDTPNFTLVATRREYNFLKMPTGSTMFTIVGLEQFECYAPPAEQEQVTKFFADRPDLIALCNTQDGTNRVVHSVCGNSKGLGIFAYYFMMMKENFEYIQTIEQAGSTFISIVSTEKPASNVPSAVTYKKMPISKLSVHRIKRVMLLLAVLIAVPLLAIILLL